MSDGKKPRREAITAAHWWGDKLRELAPAIKPVTAMTEAEFVGETANKLEALIQAARYRRAIELYETLTEENIKQFEQFLAEHLDAAMAAQRYNVASVEAFSQYDLGPELDGVLRRAGIEPYWAPTAPIFNRSMMTLLKPGHVQACGGFLEGNGEPLHELPLIDE